MLSNQGPAACKGGGADYAPQVLNTASPHPRIKKAIYISVFLWLKMLGSKVSENIWKIMMQSN